MVSSESKPNQALTWCAGLALVVAVWVVYANSLQGPFVYDDKPSTLYNPTIRSLWPPDALLQPPGGGATVSGRPVLNISFAIDYALHGNSVRGYHIGNVLIHLAGALALFGIIRRLHERSVGINGRQSAGVALTMAALWALHPLQTEAVTYIVQRAESLMALFYLLTIYCFLRSCDAVRPGRWRTLAWILCALGMGTKENMFSAPVVVFLVDRAFVAGSVAAAWRARRAFYLSLAATMLIVIGLVMTTGGNRGGSAGFNVGVSWGQYVLTQFPALARYLALSLWPSPLIFDYGSFVITDLTEIIRPVLVVTAVLIVALYAVWRHPRVGAAAALALAVLAPTSLVPGTTQMIVEHRMYLPLAAVVLAWLPVAAGCLGGGGRLALALAVLALGLQTAARNRTYHSELALWHDTAVKRPNNPVALSSVGVALTDAGKSEQAVAYYRAALQLNPNYSPALANLGLALTQSGRPADALPLLERALEINERNAQCHLNAGVALDLSGRPEEAFAHYERAVALNALLPDAHNDYGDALCRRGRLDEGLRHLQRALELEPNYAEAYFNLAAALLRLGRKDEAFTAFEHGIQIRPNDSAAYVTWGTFLQRQGHPADALSVFAAAVKRHPDSPEVHYSYGTALGSRERYAEAIPQFEAALRLRPNYAEAHNNFGNTLLAVNRLAEAISQYEQALVLRPDNASTHNNLGLALARSGRIAEAEKQFAEAVRIDPAYVEGKANLERARAQRRSQGQLP